MAGYWFTNPRQRVVITGLGVVSPCGIGRQAFWEAVVAGRSGIDWIRSFDTSDLYCKIAGEIRGFDPTDYMDPRSARKAARFSHYAVAASRLALEDSALDLSRVDPLRIGVVFGTSTAGSGASAADLYRQVDREGPGAIEMSLPTQVLAHACTSHVAIELGLKGPTSTSGAGCVGSLDAVATSVHLLRSGQAEVMVAGGAEANVSPFGMGVLCRQRVFTAQNDPPQAACKPYDQTRDGLVLSDGSGALVLETAKHAMERGAHIYAEVVSSGAATEAYHLIAADPSGRELAHAFQTALLVGKVSAEEIDYICAHGIANRQYDIAETNAFKMVLGERAFHVPVSSIKACTGQPFAAGGAWQLTAACMSIATGLVPPTINYRVPDPECDLDYVPNRARRVRVDTVMVNSHSFGGTHGCMLLRRFVERPE